MLAALRPELPRLEHVFVVRGDGPGGTTPFAALAGSPPAAPALPAGHRGQRGPRSGLHLRHDGEPKGVMHTENTTLSIMYRAIERLELSGRDVVLMASTLGHQTGFLFGHCLNLLLGATTVWMDVWNPGEAARLIEARAVTVSMGATPFLRDLTYLETGAEPALAPPVHRGGGADSATSGQDARERLGCAISAGWGMTENGMVTCNGLRDAEEKIFGSDGAAGRTWSCGSSTTQGAVLPPGSKGSCWCAGRPCLWATSSARSSPRTPTPRRAGSGPATARPLDPEGYLPSPAGRRISSSAGARTSRS